MSAISVRKVLKNKEFVPYLALSVSTALGCSVQAQGWERAKAPPLAVPNGISGENSGRWMRLPEQSENENYILETSGRQLLITQGLRVVDAPDGSLRTAREIFPIGQVVPRILPPRLGGGYLFYGRKGATTPVWRSTEFTGDLVPLATVTERVREVFPGFDRIYVQLEHARTLLALDPASGELMDLGSLPNSPSFRSLAFADEWFAAAITEVQGLQVTYDAGASWRPVELSTSPTALRVEGRTIVVEGQNRTLRLTADGRRAEVDEVSPDTLFRLPSVETLTRAPEPRKGAIASALPLGRRPLHTAALYGHPLGPNSAVVATLGGLGEVRLRDGKILRLHTSAYPGAEPCAAVSLGDGIGFVCNERGQGTQVYQLAADFSLRAIANFTSARFVSSSGNGRLVVRGRCGDEAEAAPSDFQPYCVLWLDEATTVRTREIRVRGDIGAERVVALRDGRVAVLIPPRLGTPGSLNLIGKDVEHIPLSLDPKDDAFNLLSRGLWLHGAMQVEADQIATWAVHSTSYIGVKIGLSGKVESAPFSNKLDIEKAVVSGPFALDLGTGQETTNFGFDWNEVDLPESLTTLSPTDKRKGTAKPVVGCSAVGCAYGPWLRIGRSAAPATEEKEKKNDSDNRLVAEFPKTLSYHKSAFSSWRFRCYATGERNRPTSTLARQLNRTAQERPRRSTVSGFMTPALLTSNTSNDIAEINYRSFLGVPGPTLAPHQLGFDSGEDGRPQFRAYSWGTGKSRWAGGGAWLVRAVNRYDLDSVWSTSSTVAPWANVGEAAGVFGADRVSRYSSSWRFALDPDETVGLLRIASAGSHELHLVAKDKPINSVKGTQLRNINGVVKARGEIYFGSKAGTQFRVYRMRGTGLELHGTYPVTPELKARLVRSLDGERLGILVRSGRGTWHLYPLDTASNARAPLVYSRALLNKKAPTCSDGASGWLVAAQLPPSRLTASTSAHLLDFDGPVRAQGVTGKLVLTEDAICVTELAAQLARGGSAAARLPRQSPSSITSVSMVLSDYGRDARYGFRCE